uniref:Uncharacterized protein n=1 Tax=Rhizophora mucronata TaxID=61149 RepID=A0A2P2N639_RHIMU
MGFYCRRKN